MLDVVFVPCFPSSSAQVAQKQAKLVGPKRIRTNVFHAAKTTSAPALGFCASLVFASVKKRRFPRTQPSFGGRHPSVSLKASPDDELPILVLHGLQQRSSTRQRNSELLLQRLVALLSWPAKLVASKKLCIIEMRREGATSMVPELIPEECGCFEDVVSVVHMKTGFSTSLDVSAPRVLVCAGVLEEALYPCHDFLRAGATEVGVVPQLCGASGRAGELSRARTSSHLEEVLGVKILESIGAASRWLVPAGPAFAPSTTVPQTDVTITVESADGKQLTDDQALIVSLLLPPDVSSIRLVKIGKGYTSALKFFCTPNVGSFAQAVGATTFIKMGKVEDLEEEFNVTQRMMELLGGFCPQILGYAEHRDLGALQLSLANLSDGMPKGFAEIYHDMMAQKVAGPEDGCRLLQRLESAVDFVFKHLIHRLQSAKSRRLVRFSIADELGFCRDIIDGKSETAADKLHLRTSFLLPKIWQKEPGDGGLASSVRRHMNEILGPDLARHEDLNFLAGHPLELPNVCSLLLESHDTLAKLRDATHYGHRLCFSHGDLHGDNIMVDSTDNRFLIDFGKTGLGHALEDATYLESAVVLSYTVFEDDEDLRRALDLVPILAPSKGLSGALAASDPELLQSQVETLEMSPRIAGMWAVVKRIRGQLARQVHDLASVSPGKLEDELYQACRIAALLLLRNSLFFMAARENRQEPRRRRLALAFACAYAKAVHGSV